jgi:hypothetical protein
LPIGSGYLEAQAGASTALGAYLRAELGYRVTQNVGAFAFGEASERGGAMAGLGVRLRW